MFATAVLSAAWVAVLATAATDGFEVTSSKPEDHLGTTEEVEAVLTDELAVKLRQFDDWTVESGMDGAEGAHGANGSQGGAGGGGGSQGDGNVASGTGAGQVPSEGASNGDADALAATDVDLAGEGASDDAGDGHAESEPDATGRPGSAGVAPGRRRPAGAPSVGVPSPDVDRHGREDDVARMIREAAEQETDPERKRALLEQYEEYVKSL